jgi:N-acetylglucosaminyldiphosphoundecaprenol N-acetyl-beta-D-mannosaminyltransferase
MIYFSKIPFDKFSINDLSNLRNKKICTINNEYIFHFHNNTKINNIIKKSLNVFDGSYSFYFSKFFCNNTYDNYITGIDLIHHVYNNINDFKSVTFIGGSLESNKQISLKFKNKGFKVKSWCENVQSDGTSIIQENIFDSDAIFVALGCIKQELFINNNINSVRNAKFIAGIGGAFDIFLKPQKLPKFIYKFGFGSIWRLIIEPKIFRIKRIILSIYTFRYYFK